MTEEKVKPKEIYKVIERTEADRKSRAVRVHQLFLKQKKWFKVHYETTDFDEPVMFMERRSGEVEFHEKVTAGLWEFQHSDGEKRFIIINPSKQKKFGFASRQFKGYYCHEDYPLPLPQDPFITSEQVNIIVEKSLNDMKKWKAQERKATGEMIWKIALGIALVIIAYALYKTLAPASPVPAGTGTVIKDSTVSVLNQSATILT